MNIYVINGPNINLLGTRETEIYGKETLESITKDCQDQALKDGHDVKFMQSNYEGEIVEWIQNAITEKIDRLKFAKVEEIETLKAENTQLKEAFTMTVKMLEKFEATPVDEPKKTHRNPFKQEASKVDFSKLLKKK